MNRSTALSRLLPAFLMVLLLAGCAQGPVYTKDLAAETAKPAPSAGKALVTFMRPSDVSPAVEAAVYDVTAGKTEFIGIVSAKTKTAYEVEPGERHLMVVSEAADFLAATLEPGQRYFALVSPRIGLWRSRFSLQPVTGEELTSDRLARWLDQCRWVENTDQAHAWAKKNQGGVVAKQRKYWERWSKKPEKPLLDAGQG